MRDRDKVQDLYLGLIEMSSVDDFDGPGAAADLRAHAHLWDAACVSDNTGNSGYVLRDIPEGHNHARDILLLTDEDRLPELRAIVAGWGAGKVKALTGAAASDFLRKWGGNVRPAVLRLRVY